MGAWRSGLLVLAALAGGGVPVAAEPVRDGHVTLQSGGRVNARLFDLPVAAGSASRRDGGAGMAGLAGGATVVPRFDLGLPGCAACVLPGNRIELEAGLHLHAGRQHYAEGTLAALARSGTAALAGGTATNLAIGAGLSRTTEVPRFEGAPGWAERTLVHLILEAELGHEALPGWSLVPRIHHRSGGYGTFAPAGTGSNFVLLGLRRSL